MKAEKKVNHLNILLVKAAFKTTDQIIRTDLCGAPIEVKIAGYKSGQLFIRISPDRPPKWAALFQDFLNPNSVKVPAVSAVFLIAVNDRFFALIFGQGGRFLIKDDISEDRFGLICALNSVDPKSFRCVDVQSLDAIQSHTRIQSGEETTPDQFGLDVEQDMLKAIVGTPLDGRLGNKMAGNDSLSVSVKMDLSDLPYLLDQYRKKFEIELSAENYQWINNISMVRNAAIIGVLESELISKFAENNFDAIWLSVPEIIDWQIVKGFMYTNGRREVHSDINVESFLKTVKKEIVVNLELLRQRRVLCADDDHREVFRSWSIYKCIYAEIDLGEAKYILNDGKWFLVATDFVARTNADFKKIPLSNLKLPEYIGGGEGAYNASIAERDPARYALLDKKMVMHGGAHGQVEVCDLFSEDQRGQHRFGSADENPSPPPQLKKGDASPPVHLAAARSNHSIRSTSDIRQAFQGAWSAAGRRHGALTSDCTVCFGVSAAAARRLRRSRPDWKPTFCLTRDMPKTSRSWNCIARPE